MWRGSRQQRTNTRATGTTAKRTQQTRVRLSKSKVAQQRTKKKMLIGALALLVTVSFVGAVSWVSFLDVFSVQQIAVAGVEEVRPTAIESELLLATAAARFGLFSQQNLVLYPREALEKELLTTFPRLRSAEIKRQFTQHRVVVSVEERDVYGRWCHEIPNAEQTCYHVDHTGVVFEHANNMSSDKVVITGGLLESVENPLRARISPIYFEQMVLLLDRLREISLEPTHVAFLGDDAVITLNPGWELRVALDKDLGAAAFNLKAVLDEHGLREDMNTLEYIDMRFEERVYFKHHDVVAETTDNAD